MATVIANTIIPLKGRELESLIDKLAAAVTTSLGLPPQMRSITFQIWPRENESKSGEERIDFFVYTAPNKPVEAKRALVQNIQKAVDEHFAGKVKVKTVVIIKEHRDDNVGVGGVLRADAKKQENSTTEIA
jgi:phenylpyruvate tautomerase PptA (4-oxalocrotonate tautomerase family)